MVLENQIRHIEYPETLGPGVFGVVVGGVAAIGHIAANEDHLILAHVTGAAGARVGGGVFGLLPGEGGEGEDEDFVEGEVVFVELLAAVDEDLGWGSEGWMVRGIGGTYLKGAVIAWHAY